MDKTMTKREFLTAVSELTAEGCADLAAYASAALVKMDADAEKRKGHKTEKQKAEAAAKDARAIEVAKAHLTSEAKTATDVMNELNAEGGEYKVQSVSAILKRAFHLGVANMVKVKIPKKGEQNGYTLAENDDIVAEN